MVVPDDEENANAMAEGQMREKHQEKTNKIHIVGEGEDVQNAKEVELSGITMAVPRTQK